MSRYTGPRTKGSRDPYVDGEAAKRRPVTFTVDAARTLPCTVEEVWGVLEGFSDLATWSNSIHRSWPEGEGPTTGLGAERGCELLPGRIVYERITAYEPMALMRVEATRSEGLPISSMISEYKVEGEGLTSTRISGHASLELKLPPVLLKALQPRLDAKLAERIEQAFTDLEMEIERRRSESSSSSS